ncbi:hypothetical protein NliqN6_0387 [Naganishia liquefaciens]|uniref:Uncharacterized protein n=1 Tax=Naganishia liquefaciens TaxID=104408 RepID=A0A8H3TP66_9TREE|nr:hypothetical protein NliqN6_0387 [Naganishia liquefaciens]
MPALPTCLSGKSSSPSSDPPLSARKPVARKSALRQSRLPFQYPLPSKKTVRMSLPACGNLDPDPTSGRYHDFDYRQTRGVHLAHAASVLSDTGGERPAMVPNGYRHSFQARFSGPINSDARAGLMATIAKRAEGKGGLSMILDPATEIPVYRWEGSRPAEVSSIKGPPSRQETHSAGLQKRGAASLPNVPSAKGSSRNSLHSSLSAASGSRNLESPSLRRPFEQAFQKDLPIVSWTKEVPATIPAVQMTAKARPYVRVTVNTKSPFCSQPLDDRQEAFSQMMAKMEEPRPAQTAPSPVVHGQVPASHTPFARRTCTSASSSLSVTPSMRIPRDAMHGKATQIEVFSAPYNAQRGKRPPKGPLSASAAPAVHPGLQAGRYVTPAHPAFPAFPPFPDFPAFPAFPKFPAFPTVSRSRYTIIRGLALIE